MFMTLLMSVAIVSAISLFLALLMVIADATIGNYGDVMITVNDDKKLTVKGGQPLLKALNGEGIFIPLPAAGGVPAVCAR